VKQHKYSIIVSTIAQLEVDKIENQSTINSIFQSIRTLANNPARKGKRLRKKLRGYYRIKAVEGRFRVIYGVYREQKIVMIVFLGKRRVGSKSDVYEAGVKAVKAYEHSKENLTR